MLIKITKPLLTYKLTTNSGFKNPKQVSIRVREHKSPLWIILNYTTSICQCKSTRHFIAGPAAQLFSCGSEENNNVSLFAHQHHIHHSERNKQAQQKKEEEEEVWGGAEVPQWKFCALRCCASSHGLGCAPRRRRWPTPGRFLHRSLSLHLRGRSLWVHIQKYTHVTLLSPCFYTPASCFGENPTWSWLNRTERFIVKESCGEVTRSDKSSLNAINKTAS